MRLKGYNLAPFQAIMEEIKTLFGSLDALKGKRLLELGPGTRVEMMRYLLHEIHVESIRGAGKAMVWPWTRHKVFIRDHVERDYFLDFFRKTRAARYDLIYSRYVMERHSIDPWILLFSRAYWTQFKKRRFSDFDENYPASLPNVEAVFRSAFKALHPGGVIISQMAKLKNSGLSRELLKSLRPESMTQRDLGRFSSMVTVVKEKG